MSTGDDPPPNSPADVGYGPAAVTPLPAPTTFKIPRGTPARSCSSCKAKIFFVLSAKSRWMPVNPDGVSHFATCPNANEHRR